MGYILNRSWRASFYERGAFAMGPSRVLLLILFGLFFFVTSTGGALISGIKDLVNGGIDQLTENAIEVNVELFSAQIELMMNLRESTSALKEFVDVLALPEGLHKANWRDFTGPRSIGICIICRTFAHSAIKFRRIGFSEEKIAKTLIKLCGLLNLSSHSVCRGLIDLNLPVFVYIIDNKKRLTAKDVCGVVLQRNSCCKPNEDEFEWSIDLGKSSNSRSEAAAAALWQQKSSLGPYSTFELIQISDIHYDPKYEPSGNADCDEPTCCRRGQNFHYSKAATTTTIVAAAAESESESENRVTTDAKIRQAAGFWGDYNRCDTPLHSVLDAFNAVLAVLQRQSSNQNDGGSMMYFTGDIIDHGVWETSRQGNAQSIHKIYALMRQYFPNIIVYPLVGNHEPHPLNLFAPSSMMEEKFSTKWLYNLLADIWIDENKWLPESTRATILRGGFYTVVPHRGFRIIALNNNVCYTLNWWLLLEPRDPDGQLRWLAETLLEAENSGQVVHILAHIPPGAPDCYSTWGRELRKIVDRFSHIIAAQFNGHTHNDELRIYYDLADKAKAINVAWNGGSITTYSNLNPNFKAYSVNSHTYKVEDAASWMYNLTEANLSPGEAPKWFQLTSFKKQYGLQNLSMASLDDWIHRLSRSESLTLQYQWNFVKFADPSIASNCDSMCIKKHICSIVTTDFEDQSACEMLADTLINSKGESRFPTSRGLFNRLGRLLRFNLV